MTKKQKKIVMKIDIKQTEDYKKAVKLLESQKITPENARKTFLMASRTRQILSSWGLG